MRVGQQESMKLREPTYRDARCAHPGEKPTQPIAEVRVGQYPHTSKIQQQSGVAYIGDTQLGGRRGNLTCSFHGYSVTRARRCGVHVLSQ